MTIDAPRLEHMTPWLNQVHHGDCLDLMRRMPDGCVDMVLADLPYGTTENKWDTIIDLPQMWAQFERIAKQNAAIVLTAAQPFTSTLVYSNRDMFKYDWIWHKTIASNQLNVKHQPLRAHETVLVFYRQTPTYNPQMTDGEPWKANRKNSKYNDRGYNNQRDHQASSDGTRHPKSVLRVSNPRIKGGHPTQKPVELFEYLIRTYTNPGDVVLDPVLGSGTTAVAAESLKRNWVGMEAKSEYVAMANRRIDDLRNATDAA